MPKFTSHLYTIEALTNLHPGSGDVNYSTVDKTVQRDPATGYPTIHSSSLKGALRKYFEEETDMGDRVTYIFGDRPENGSQEAEQKGAYRFFSAQLLSLPLRSNYRPYYQALSNGTLETLTKLCEYLLSPKQFTFGDALEKLKLPEDAATTLCYVLDTVDGPISVEGYPAMEAQHVSTVPDTLSEFIDKRPVLFSSRDLSQITKNQLPVIARNQLDNGESKNLWYEEVLPRMTKFYFFVQVPQIGKNHFTDFEKELNNKIVQIGANASIGYGYCLIKKIV